MRLTHRAIQGYTLLYTEEQKHLVVVWEYVHIHTTPYSLLILGGEKDKKKRKKVWVHSTASGAVGDAK